MSAASFCFWAVFSRSGFLPSLIPRQQEKHTKEAKRKTQQTGQHNTQKSGKQGNTRHKGSEKAAGTIPTLILNHKYNKIFIWKTGGGYHSLIFKESK